MLNSYMPDWEKCDLGKEKEEGETKESMSPQDKVERVLKEIHVCRVYHNEVELQTMFSHNLQVHCYSPYNSIVKLHFKYYSIQIIISID